MITRKQAVKFVPGRHVATCRRPAGALIALGLSVTLGCAAGSGGSGATWSGGQDGQVCNPQTQATGCALHQGAPSVMQCGAEGVWSSHQACIAGESCRELPVPGAAPGGPQLAAECFKLETTNGGVANDSSALDGGGASDASSQDSAPQKDTAPPQDPAPPQDTAPVLTTPLPKLNLLDINPGSPHSGQTYGLEPFAGRYIVALMGAGWCASCNAQADFMEKIKGDLEKQGRDDFIMIVINDQSAASASHKKAMITCDYANMCPQKGGNLSYPVLQGTASQGWKTFVDGTGKTGVKNDCFIYGKDGALVFKHVGKGTVNLTQFDNEVRAALKP